MILNICLMKMKLNILKEMLIMLKQSRKKIKRGLYYVEKMNNLSTSDIKNIKEKLVNNNNKIKRDPNECKGIKYIRYLFNEDKNKN